GFTRYLANSRLMKGELSNAGSRREKLLFDSGFQDKERPQLKIVVAPVSFLWPGFNGVVRYGLWSQLAIALIFGALCQSTLALNFLWCDFLSQYVKNALYVGLFVSWFFLNVVASVRLKQYEKMRRSDSRGEAFLEAQTHYLKGNWFETECCLKTILKKNPLDADAILFLATLYRHVKRFSEAKRMLAALEKLDDAYRWQYEITLEKNFLREDVKNERSELKAEIESDDLSSGMVPNDGLSNDSSERVILKGSFESDQESDEIRLDQKKVRKAG
ncbi:MAG: tetratricopeptide repeat protein, partial [Thermoguttaceae bacterium]|nr:tetratricopeptide repeat protein [Thermoguttaceae bacterium]